MQLSLPDTRMLPALTIEDVPQTTARFLALRKAGAAFRGPYDVRSERFATVLVEEERLRIALEALQTTLVQHLYEAVSCAVNDAQRRQLLSLKRLIFNGRALPEEHLATQYASIGSLLTEYQKIQSQLATLFDRHLPAVMDEYHDRLARLWDDTVFRAACTYASPHLVEAKLALRARSSSAFTNLDRGLYSYATKFVSKANPFHLFSMLGLGKNTYMKPQNDCEIVLDVIDLYHLEYKLLCMTNNHEARLVYVRNYVHRDGNLVFLIYEGATQKILRVPETSLLNSLLTLFQEKVAPVRFTDLEAHIRRHVPEASSERIRDYLVRLIRSGIMVQYLITNFNNFGYDLAQAKPELTSELGELQRYHHLAAGREEVPAIEQRLRQLRIEGQSVGHFVNRYNRNNSEVQAHATIATLLSQDLIKLKPFFFHLYNFSSNASNLQAFVRDYLQERGLKEAPYLDILLYFLENKEALLARYRDHAHRPPHLRRAIAEWSARMSCLEGRIEAEEMQQMITEIPQGGQKRNLCYNGTYDYKKSIFYISNIWDAKGRFVRRYLANHAKFPIWDVPVEAPGIDVQLATPFFRNRNYVADVLETGCSLEAYHRHRFRQWIWPSEVVLTYVDGQVAYRHAVSGVPLRFHFLGTLMNGLLDPEYQLLLTDAADVFWNVFDHRQAPQEEFTFRPGLYYGAVCLRRDRWAVRKRLLPIPASQQNPLASAAQFRRWVHTRMQTAVDDWYCRLEDPGRKIEDPVFHKPFYLDTANPLSICHFRKMVSPLPESGTIYFERMEPPLEHLMLSDGKPYMTEIMLEV
jgi:hypothetical protein